MPYQLDDGSKRRANEGERNPDPRRDDQLKMNVLFVERKDIGRKIVQSYRRRRKST